MEMGEVFIQFKDVWKSFDTKKIFTGLELEVFKGEVLTVIGGSGTGKSVTLKMLIGLLRPDKGRILFDGQDVATMKEGPLIGVRKRIGMLFQGGALFDSISVKENVAYGLRENRSCSEKELDERVRENLARVGLDGCQKMRPADLSGGMKKRVALARAIAIEPEVMLYDEPTTGLDPINTARINHLITHLNQDLKITSIVVTHDMGSAFTISDRLAMIFNHRIAAVGTTEEIENSEDPVVRNFIEGTYREY